MFYTFVQNNSGGKYHRDDEVTMYVILEADSARDANHLACSHGIYFFGTSTGKDCSCCGDRWEQVSDEDGNEAPLVYGQDPKDLAGFYHDGGVYARVFFKNGYVQEHRVCVKNTKPKKSGWFTANF